MLNVALHLTTPQSEMQWDYVLSHFKPDSVILLNDFEPTSNVMKGALRDMPDDVPRILMAPRQGRYISGEFPLDQFAHPANATYIFGPDFGHVSDLEADIRVYIPTDTHDEMFSWVAGAITLWHRRYG